MINRYIIISHWSGLNDSKLIQKLEGDSTGLSTLLEFIEDKEFKNNCDHIIEAYKLKAIDEVVAFNTISFLLDAYSIAIEVIDDKYDKLADYVDYDGELMMIIDGLSNNLEYITPNEIDKDNLTSFVEKLMKDQDIEISVTASQLQKLHVIVNVININTLVQWNAFNYLLRNNDLRSYIY